MAESCNVHGITHPCCDYNYCRCSVHRAAYEMLEALRTVEHNISSLVNAYPERYGRGDWQGTWDLARRAIAKAEGRSDEESKA